MSQLKIKNGNNWESIPASGMGVPSGGSSGQYLKKSSSTDYATEWENFPSWTKNVEMEIRIASGTAPSSWSAQTTKDITFTLNQAFSDDANMTFFGFCTLKTNALPIVIYSVSGTTLEARCFNYGSTAATSGSNITLTVLGIKTS